MSRASEFPLGHCVTVEMLEDDPHPHLRRLREGEPVSWLPALEGWLVTSYDAAATVMRDANAYTVDDPRFSTAQVVGPSMLSLDGSEHDRHRDPFTPPFRPRAVSERFGGAVEAEADRLVTALRSRGAGELRRGFAGPLAAAVVSVALGLRQEDVPAVLECYGVIVSDVTDITAGRSSGSAGRSAYTRLTEMLHAVLRDRSDSLLAAAANRSGALSEDQVMSNAAVLLFGGIETTEGMIANALLHLLERPAVLAAARSDPSLLSAAIEESLRLEPAAAVIDRYVTRAMALGEAELAVGELVRISIAGANRDPAVFTNPDAFRLERTNARRHLAFAQGPHVCVGVHLARLEARTGIMMLLERLPALRLDPSRRSHIRGLVFRKPAELNVLWAARADG